MQKAVLSLRGEDGFFMYGIEKEWREGKVLKEFRLKPGVAIKNPFQS